ncbi:hypothetical protein M8J77_017236 [Diaphorina citri]|nr:hypothetical protein M8J77_017236 [Diaphorina citri]
MNSLKLVDEKNPHQSGQCYVAVTLWMEIQRLFHQYSLNVDKKFEIHFPPPEKRRKRSKSSPPPELASEEPTRELSPQPGPSSQTTGTSWLPTSSRDVRETEIYFLNKELAELRSKKKASESQVLFFNMIEDSDTKVAQYTGLPSKAHFDILLGLISSLSH